MAKFHINPKGDAGECKAKSGACPFGGEDKHHSTPEAAREAFEKEMDKEYTNVNSNYRRIAVHTSRDFSTPVKERMLRDVEAGTNKFAAPQIGKILAKDFDPRIRERVVTVIKSQKLITKLVDDDSKIVRKAVAVASRNPEVLRKLLNDSDPAVRNAAAANSHSPRRIPKDPKQALAAKAMKTAKAARIEAALAIANKAS